ncbi:MAG: tetratricopeptide repeat protein [Planctomycetota bacterium]
MSRGLLAGAAILAILLSGGLLWWCLTADSPRVIVVGIDGAEWDIINPLIDAGKLPNLARLKREGVHGVLRSFEPMLSPIIWTSIATGKLPEKHGIGWFMVQSEETGNRLPVTSSVRKCKALWNILTEADLSSGVLGWWATYPAETVNGFIVTDFIAYHNFGVTGQDVKSDLGKTYPLDLIEEIAPDLAAPEALTYDSVRWFADVTVAEFEIARSKGYDFPEPLSHFLHILATARSYTTIGTRLYQQRAPEFFAVYYEGVDSVSHLFMKHADPPMPDVSEESRRKFGHLVTAFYEYQDEALGRYLELAGKNTYVIVVSDHGFKTGEERPQEGEEIRVGIAHHWHNLDGVILMKGPGMKVGEELPESSVLDITPTILYALDLPVAEDMDGHVILDAFRPSHLLDHPLKTTASYEAGTTRGEAVSVDEGIARAMDEGLHALGYVGQTPEDSSPEIHLNLANRHLQQGNLAAAEQELKIALRMQPGLAGAHQQLADIYLKQNRFSEAKKALRYAATLAPEVRGLWMRVANIASLCGDYQESLEALEIVKQRNPGAAEVYVAMGDVYSRIGSYQDAEDALRQALQIEEDNVPAHFNLGVVLQALDRTDEAREEYETVLALQPKHPYALNNLGNILSMAGKHEEALGHFRSSVELQPENFEAVYNYGTTCLALHRVDEALEYLKKAVTLKPDGLLAHKNLAAAYRGKGNAAKAFQEYKTMTRLFPHDYECWVEAARLLKRPEGEEQVAELLAGAWMLDPDRTAQLIGTDPAFAGFDADRITNVLNGRKGRKEQE